MAHVLVCYTLLVVIIICIMFVKKLENVVKHSEFGYTREQRYTKVICYYYYTQREATLTQKSSRK